jgi:hypothetical protein
MLLFAFINVWSGLAAIGFLYSIIAVPRYAYKAFQINKNGCSSNIKKWLVFVYPPLVTGLFLSILFFHWLTEP